MPLPARLMAEDEDVVLDLRRHGWVLARPLALAALAVGVAAAGAVLAVPTAAAWALVAVLAVALGHLLAAYLRWRATSLVVTTGRVVLRSGLVRSAVRDIPLAAVGEVSCRRGLWDRVIGCGDVVIESAARDGREVLTDLPDPLAVQLALVRLQGGGARAGPPLSLPEQLERLEGLRARGILDDAELASAKARLLHGP